jgi:hypothetical protein
LPLIVAALLYPGHRRWWHPDQRGVTAAFALGAAAVTRWQCREALARSSQQVTLSGGNSSNPDQQRGRGRRHDLSCKRAGTSAMRKRLIARSQRDEAALLGRFVQIVARSLEFEFAKWKQLLSIRLEGAFLTTCAAEMYRQKSGSMIYMRQDIAAE